MDADYKDPRSRKWLITINNPQEHGFSHDVIKEKLSKIKNLDYWCMSDEIGEEQTYHTHIGLSRGSAIRFSQLKKMFPPAHLDMCKGSMQEVRNYITKSGPKWEKHKKKETNLPDTFEEYGECPIEAQGARNDITNLYDMIKDGFSDYEIIDANPQYMLKIDKIERARQIVRDNQFKNTFRNIEVTYIFGDSGVGKTRSVMEEFGYDKVYRVTNYDQHPWDGYDGQDVVVFEEFRSSFRIQDMLNYLDGYPLNLPCRYANKVACFTKVFIITNIPLEEQFVSVQKDHPETWQAFLRRLHKVKKYSSTGIKEYSLKDYLKRFDWTEAADTAETIYSLAGLPAVCK